MMYDEGRDWHLYYLYPPPGFPDPYPAPTSARSFLPTLLCSDLRFPEIASARDPLLLPKLRRMRIANPLLELQLIVEY